MNLSELRVLYDALSSKEEVKIAIKSIDNNLIDISDIEKDNYFVCDGFMYSYDYYVIDYYGNALHVDNSSWCEYYEEYFPSDEMNRVCDGRNDVWYSDKAISNSLVYWVECRDCYMTDNGMEYHNIVYAEDTGNYCYADDCYFNEDDGCYYEEDRNVYVRDYHNGSYRTKTFNNKSKWLIGFEIEKEDEEVKESINILDFEEKTEDLWRKEKDGSLSSCSGYELISPTFEFNIKEIFNHIESNDVLVKHINASYSTSCGGHIHLSKEGLSGEELFDKIKGYTPLFYALYYGRVNRNYCKGKNNKDLKNDNEKYQAIKIHDNRIEFRIISAVPNVQTLKWRAKLLQMITKNLTDDVRIAYFNVDTKFTKLLKEVYDEEGMNKLKERFIDYTLKFENINLK